MLASPRKIVSKNRKKKLALWPWMRDSSRAMDAKQEKQSAALAAPAAFWPLSDIRRLAEEICPATGEFTKTGTCRLLAVIAVSFGLPEEQAGYYAAVLETLAAYNTSALRQQMRDSGKRDLGRASLPVDWVRLAKLSSS
jgi:hypothetical protein